MSTNRIKKSIHVLQRVFHMHYVVVANLKFGVLVSQFDYFSKGWDKGEVKDSLREGMKVIEKSKIAGLSLLYGCESWVMNAGEQRTIEDLDKL